MYYKFGHACVTIWGSFLLLQIGITSVATNWGSSGYYKLGQNVIKNWGSYYKLQKPLLTKVAVITNWSKFITNCVRYYKLGQLLQIGT